MNTFSTTLAKARDSPIARSVNEVPAMPVLARHRSIPADKPGDFPLVSPSLFA
jgi:hypothetical protein